MAAAAAAAAALVDGCGCRYHHMAALNDDGSVIFGGGTIFLELILSSQFAIIQRGRVQFEGGRGV